MASKHYYIQKILAIKKLRLNHYLGWIYADCVAILLRTIFALI